MMSLTNEDKTYIVSRKIVMYAIKDLVLKMKIKKYHKVKNHCHYVENIEELLIILII